MPSLLLLFGFQIPFLLAGDLIKQNHAHSDEMCVAFLDSYLLNASLTEMGK